MPVASVLQAPYASLVFSKFIAYRPEAVVPISSERCDSLPHCQPEFARFCSSIRSLSGNKDVVQYIGSSSNRVNLPVLQNFRSQPRNIKLDKLAGLPNVRMLEDMRQKAMVNPGAIVELPFGDDTQSFNLTVTRDVTQGSWLWMMYRDDGFNSGLEWSHVTHNADQIHSLISNSNLGFMANRQVQPLPTSVQLAQTSASVEDNAPKARKGTLQGNLKNIQIGNLCQSINMNQMTGRLEIVAPHNKAAVFFVDGNPIHAALRGAEGTEAMIQLQAWTDGEFTFYDENVNVTRSIQRGLIGLLMEGAKFVDHFKYLTNSGLTHDSYLIPVKDVDLEEALTKGVDCKLSDVIAIYKLIDGAKTWGDIQRDLELAKSEWAPVMFNLVSCGLVQISTTPTTKSTRQRTSATKMDWQTVQAFEQNICRTDTGLYTHPSLLFFLSQEWFKFEVMQVPFSLLVFGFANKTEPNSQLIPFRARAIQDLRQKVFKTKRTYDLLCHYGAFSYAMLLPMSNRSSAHRQAEILAEICATIVVSEDYDRDNIEFRAGIANIPEDCSTLDEFLTLAEQLSVLGD